MKTKVKFNIAQRNELARIFKEMLRDEKVYTTWGPSLKAFYEEHIAWYFNPFLATYDKLPEVECELREERDDKDVLINVVYRFRLELVFSAIKEMRRTLVLEKEINKRSLDNVV